MIWITSKTRTGQFGPFKKAVEAISHKAENDLGHNWRIRDTRGANELSSEDFLTERMAVIASTFLDHVNYASAGLRSRLTPSAALSHREEVAKLFEQTLLELENLADLGRGKWKAMTGYVHDASERRQSAWVQSGQGDIIELVPATGLLKVIHTNQTAAGNYEIKRSLNPDYNDLFAMIMRGERGFEDQIVDRSRIASNYIEMLAWISDVAEDMDHNQIKMLG